MSENDNLFEDMEQGQKTDETKDDVTSALQDAANEVKEQATDSVFDYNALPDAPAQKYNRVELDGQTLTVSEAVIELPPADAEWQKTLNGEGLYKSYGFKVAFDTPNNDREFLSGLKGFKQENGDLSHPSLFRTGKNQVALLFKAYKVKVLKSGVPEKEFDEKYGLKKFMAFLNSNPKAVVETVSIDFQGKTHRKNLVKEFV